MKLHILLLVVLVIILFSSHLARAEETKPAATPTPMTVTDAWADGKRVPAPSPAPGATPEADTMFADAGLRDRIWVEVEHLADAKINPRDLVLYLNGQEVKGIKAVAVDGPKKNWLGFDLLKTEE